MNAHALRIEHHRYGPKCTALADEFERLAYATREENAALQSERLNRLVGWAMQNSAYYQQTLRDVGLSPKDTITLHDLHKLPLLTKDELRSRLPEIVSSGGNRRGWLHGHTSGTTGAPLSLWYDRSTCVATNAADRLQKRFAAVDDSQSVGLLLGRQVVPASVIKPPYWHENYVQRQVWYSSLHMNEDRLSLYVDDMRKRRLSAVEGYPSTLYVLARFLLDRGETLPVKAVFSSSETLLSLQREAIEAAFAAPLFDYFGHAERTIFAVECKQHKGKHLVEPFGITEVVDANGELVPDGEFGFLTGTSLYNLAMPMIRYRTGDISAIDRTPCECGSSFPRIVGVSTKAEDIVILADGRWLSPSVLTHPFKPFPSIRKSQIVQESVSDFTVRLVSDDGFSAELQRELLANLHERLGPEVNISVENVDDIAPDPSGKFRWVISRVPHKLSVVWK